MKPAFSLGHQAGTGHLPGFLDEHVCPRVSPWGSPLPAAMVSLWSSFSSAFRMCHDDYPPWECGICYSSVPHVLGTVLKLYYWLTLNSAGIHCTSVVGSQNEWEWDKALLLIWEKKKRKQKHRKSMPQITKVWIQNYARHCYGVIQLDSWYGNLLVGEDCEFEASLGCIRIPILWKLKTVTKPTVAWDLSPGKQATKRS